MEETEVPIEAAQEHIHEAAAHSSHSWITYVALSSALLAVLAAITALLSGHHVNEAMISQIKASDKWSYYQAKGIKSAILESRIQVLEGLGKEVSAKDTEKVAQYKTDQAEISHEAEEFQKESETHLSIHEILARAVTMFQVSIAIGAIAALTRRKYFWYVSLVFGALGAFYFVQSLI